MMHLAHALLAAILLAAAILWLVSLPFSIALKYPGGRTDRILVAIFTPLLLAWRRWQGRL